ncbi:hypothetical protein [Polaromonas sp. YR568]|uniref:hypothetical protein n=1 Tax=Polaromonas sp. YR568 TaxID=1855301 RepID=UPI0031382F44
MSHSIYIFDTERLKLLRPYTIALLWNHIQKFRDEPAPVNPRYVKLASTMLEEFPTREMLVERGEDERDSVWLNSPLNEARQITQAVWHMDLPTDQGPQVLAKLVKYGTQLGLTMYNDQLGIGFLPDGGVIPSERAEEWEAFQDEAESIKHPTKAQMRSKMRKLFTDSLAAHGFSPYEVPVRLGFDAAYLRQDADAWQVAAFFVKERYGNFYCEVKFYGANFAARAVYDAAMSTVSKPGDWVPGNYEFGLNDVEWPRRSPFLIDTQQHIEELNDWLLNKAIPLLDRVRTVEGLNWLMNHPDMEFLGRYLREVEYTSLITAWLTKNPCFEERVRRFAQIEAEEAQRPNGRPAGRLARLLTHLRER